MKKTLFLFSLLALTAFGFSQITLESGAQLIIASGSTVIANDGIVNNDGLIDNDGTIEIKGDLENNTSALITSTSTGTVKFNGSAAQEITGTADADFYGTVIIDNSNGVALTNTATGSDQTIHGTLTFTSGLLALNARDLTLGTTDPSGVGSTKYVQTNGAGTVKRTVAATDVVFPVGNSAYNPITLNNAGTSDTYTVKVNDSKPASFVGTTHIVNRSWVVGETTSGGSNLTVTAQWNGSEEASPFDETNSALGVTTDNGLNVAWGSTANASGGDPYTQSSTGITTVGEFMVGDYFYSGKSLNLKLFLAGAFNGTNMDKDLNTAALIPTTDPYGLSTTVASIPTNAVDWVKVELRDQTTPSTVLHSFAFFVDVNGDLLDGDGTTGGKVTGFDNTVPYYVAVQHRNHFGIMTATTVDLSTASPTFDYTTAQAQAWQDGGVGTNAAMKLVSSAYCLWQGDVNQDGEIQFASGSAPDQVEILNYVGISTPGNIVTNVYRAEDVNLDTEVQFASGANPDQVIILNNVGISTPGNILTRHLP